MDDTPPKKKSYLEELESNLYNPDYKGSFRERRKIHNKDVNIKSEFDIPEEEKEFSSLEKKYKLPTSFFKKVFFLTLGFFIVTSLFFAFSLYQGKKRVSQDLIAMEIQGNSFVDGGEPVNLEIKIQNHNQQNLELPDLILMYPKDSSEGAEMTIERRSLPDLAEGELAREKFSFPLFGQAGDIRSVRAILEYRIAGSSAIFEKEISHSVTIRSTPTEVSVSAPSIVVRNQNVVFGVTIRANSSTHLQKLLLEIQYPPGFQLLDTNTQQFFSDNVWYFERIPEEGLYVEVVGTLSALENQSQSFKVLFGEQSTENKNSIATLFNSLVHVITVQKAFIDTTLFVNGDNSGESVVRGGSDISLRVLLKNTLDEVLDNVRLQINLDGTIYDPKTISLQNGFYDSSKKAIIFDHTTSRELVSLSPGEQKELSVTLKGQNLVSSQGVLSAPSLNVSVDVSATKKNGQLERASSLSRHTVKANSDMSVLPVVQYYEGPFQNSGPLPPRVDTPTTYTLTFQLSNSSNNLENVELNTTFPPNVVWLGNIAPSIERNNVSYDSITRKMIWKPSKLPAGVGVGDKTPEQLSVQLRVTPSSSQVGSPINLTGDIFLSGFDTFTKSDLSYTKLATTNRIVGSSVPGADGRVVQ
ncbi:MAG: hypothetical protein PHC89_01110 [Candidatus Pacebacteria bacterium]|nr:hypothetical protein [Candidatus Paceibacterota bacterium]